MRSNAALIIAVQSSGSIRSARAVTGLRSPVRRAARIFEMSGAGAAEVSRTCVDASAGVVSPSGLPQLAQNLASGATLASQRGHDRAGDSTVIGWPSYCGAPIRRPPPPTPTVPYRRALSPDAHAYWHKERGSG